MEMLCVRCGKRCHAEVKKGERLAFCSFAPPEEREKQADMYVSKEARRDKRRK